MPHNISEYHSPRLINQDEDAKTNEMGISVSMPFALSGDISARRRNYLFGDNVAPSGKGVNATNIVVRKYRKQPRAITV
jgi:hypothetical protein